MTKPLNEFLRYSEAISNGFITFGACQVFESPLADLELTPKISFIFEFEHVVENVQL